MPNDRPVIAPLGKHRLSLVSLIPECVIPGTHNVKAARGQGCPADDESK